MVSCFADFCNREDPLHPSFKSAAICRAHEESASGKRPDDQKCSEPLSTRNHNKSSVLTQQKKYGLRTKIDPSEPVLAYSIFVFMEDTNMKPIISCKFNMDTACVEFKFLNGDPEAYPRQVTDYHPLDT